MLYIPASTTEASLTTPRLLYPPDAAPIKILNAKSFAHGTFVPFQLARLAADWCDGRLLLRPTVELASRIFGNVSRAAIRRERQTRAAGSLPLGLLTYGWRETSEIERELFVRTKLAEIWSIVDRVTTA